MVNQGARLWLVRHGLTDWNAEGRIQGHTPTHLNEIGRAQSLALGKLLAGREFAAIWSSDLPRAAQTAELLIQGAALALPVERTEDLRERSFGQYEGATSQEIHAARTALGLHQTGDLADWTGMPGIEPDALLWQRVASRLRLLSDQYPGKDVLVVTHGGVVARAIYEILGIPTGTPRRFPLSNGIIAIIQFRVDSWYLLSFIDMPLAMNAQGSGGRDSSLMTATQEKITQRITFSRAGVSPPTTGLPRASN